MTIIDNFRLLEDGPLHTKHDLQFDPKRNIIESFPDPEFTTLKSNLKKGSKEIQTEKRFYYYHVTNRCECGSNLKEYPFREPDVCREVIELIMNTVIDETTRAEKDANARHCKMHVARLSLCFPKQPQISNELMYRSLAQDSDVKRFVTNYIRDHGSDVTAGEALEVKLFFVYETPKK